MAQGTDTREALISRWNHRARPVDEAKNRVLPFIVEYFDQYGEAPSLRKIAIGLGLAMESGTHIARHVNKLVEEGYLHKTRGIVTGLTGKHLEDSK